MRRGQRALTRLELGVGFAAVLVAAVLGPASAASAKPHSGVVTAVSAASSDHRSHGHSDHHGHSSPAASGTAKHAGKQATKAAKSADKHVAKGAGKAAKRATKSHGLSAERTVRGNHSANGAQTTTTSHHTDAKRIKELARLARKAGHDAAKAVEKVAKNPQPVPVPVPGAGNGAAGNGPTTRTPPPGTKPVTTSPARTGPRSPPAFTIAPVTAVTTGGFQLFPNPGVGRAPAQPATHPQPGAAPRPAGGSSSRGRGTTAQPQVELPLGARNDVALQSSEALALLGGLAIVIAGVMGYVVWSGRRRSHNAS
ncbi:MAG: hypothetical protein ACRDVG_16705 [Jatrophihabitantaceae bacterium]